MTGRRLLACVIGGLVLGVLEALVVTAADYGMFLSYRELGRLTATTLATDVLLVVLAGLPWSVLGPVFPQFARRGFLWAALLAWPALLWAAWLLTSGRRAAELPLRSLGVFILGTLGALAVAGVIRLVDRARGSRRQGWVILGSTVALTLAVLAADSVLLRRLYPVFHTSLAALACLLGVQLARLIDARMGSVHRVWVMVGASVVLVTPVPLGALLDSPTARFAVERCAPLAGKLVRHLPRAQAPSGGGEGRPIVAAPAAQLRSGLDLSERDVLLITVDALRADVLRAYGGNGLTPEMDRLADESAVFLRAYTPTPHTSYAVTSLLTGKYMRGVMALSDGDAQADGGHVTLARVLRRYGYRTAGFYPPAIFFVDGKRFDTMRRERLGFEYAKEMFASAQDRVAQLKGYLEQVGGEHRVFAWVHLFEPHEPYEPAEGFARGDTPRDRYDGEVAAVDAAVAQLVQVFRAIRPTATVILTADHGEEFGDHGGYHHGTTLFDEQVRVPLLWSSPGAVRPGAHRLAVDTVDIVPTILGTLGIPPDARMRGDDLSAELGGAPPDPTRRAFAAVDDARMVTDGRYKAVCHHGGHCQLFDLEQDPGELRDLSAAQPERVAALRADLTRLVASIPRVEALALGGASGWPAALARAKLGDATVAGQLPALLGAADPEVRAAAAEACGRLRVAAARTVLGRLRTEDSVADVRASAAIAGLSLGDDAALEDVVSLAQLQADGTGGRPRAQAHRAGVALAGRGDARGVGALTDMATDTSLDEVARRAAIEALGALGALGKEPAVSALVATLDEVRLRPAASAALGRIGTPVALDAIAARFAQERYPESRAAQARALVDAGDGRARGLIERFLGTATSVPGGVQLLVELGGLGRATPCGADLRAGRSALGGEWHCDAGGCEPGADARLELRGVAGDRRLSLRVAAAAQATLTVAGGVHTLRPGLQELGIAVEAGASSLRVEGAGRIEAFACVATADDIAPPPPVPWKPDAGVEL